MKTILTLALTFTASAYSTELTPSETFEQEYEAVFAEKPSATVWTLGKNEITGPRAECGGGCGGGGSGDSGGSSDGCCIIF